MDRAKTKLPYLDIRRWRWRWMYTINGGIDCKIHRVAKSEGYAKHPDGGRYAVKTINGTTLCGVRGLLQMPGIFSRIGRERCRKCCAKLGIPNGLGNPYNKNLSEVSQ